MIRSNDPSVRLDDCTPEQLVSGGRTVICLFDGFDDLIAPADGIFAFWNLATAGSYADSDDIQHVMDDQKTKFRDFAPRPGLMFEMSWTGTWHSPFSPCIDRMADDLRQRLLSSMQDWVAGGLITRQKRPNIVWVDYYDQRIMDTIIYLNTIQR